MFRLLTRKITTFGQNTRTRFSTFTKQTKPNPILRTTCFASLPFLIYMNRSLFVTAHQDEDKKGHQLSTADPNLIQNPTTIWEKTKSVLSHLWRFLQLIAIFLPPILLLPLKLFKINEKLWLRCFVSAVERAGVVYIKAFQYLSHRRDVIGAEMAQGFNHLRQNAPQHSFEQTKDIFRRAYRKEIPDLFEEFDENPIASASVSQVYKGVYKGKKVAIKVRHPDVDKYIQRDVNIMFGISKFLSLFSKAFQIPVGEQSLKKTLIDQIDFNVQKDNLKIFNHHFDGNQSINFPKPLQKQTRDAILIQSFAQGVPVTHFQNNRHPLNAVIARLGATTFFQMLMKNNFIHADCHGGNILVQVSKQSATFFSEIKNYFVEKYYLLEQKMIVGMVESEILKSLYRSSRDEQKKIRQMLRNCTQEVKIHVIDAGMVIRLQEDDRMNFTNFLKSLMEGHSQKCANLIYKLSNFDNEKIIEGKFKDYKNQLHKLFSVIDNTSIFDLQAMKLLIGMLNIIRDNHMKLDGQFATLITNMVVLESIAKQIDPNIQLLKCAIPYFQFVKDPLLKSKPTFEKRDNPITMI